MERNSRQRLVRSMRTVAGGLGLVLLVVAVIGSRWDAGPITSPTDRFLSAAIGALLAAIAILGPRFGPLYRATAVVLLNSFLLAGSLELGSAAIERFKPEDEEEPETRNSILASQPFQQKHAVEFAAADAKRYEPYVLWRAAPYSGDTINVNEAGIRDIPAPPCREDGYKIVTFGGSAMWGAGAADSETIPAFLRAILKDQTAKPICVTNYSQVGYVLAQTVAELVNLLLKGERPDLVISYDGFNDVYVAYQQGLAHRHFHYEDARRIFEPDQTHWYQQLSLYWRVRGLPSGTGGWRDYTTMGIDAQELAEAIANHYFNSYTVMEALAEKWGFDIALFVQPIIVMGDKRLTAAETVVKNDIAEPLEELITQTYERLKRGAEQRGRLFYIADVFDDVGGEVWFDSVHVSGVGNRIVAERIASVLTKGGIPLTNR